jgi:hypothetical protein
VDEETIQSVLKIIENISFKNNLHILSLNNLCLEAKDKKRNNLIVWAFVNKYLEVLEKLIFIKGLLIF